MNIWILTILMMFSNEPWVHTVEKPYLTREECREAGKDLDKHPPKDTKLKWDCLPRKVI